jgi:hypothetical protein
MEVHYDNKTVKLSDWTIYSTKSFYNQPVLIFLLENNFVMMYIYNDKPDIGPVDKLVVGMNLTD